MNFFRVKKIKQNHKIIFCIIILFFVNIKTENENTEIDLTPINFSKEEVNYIKTNHEKELVYITPDFLNILKTLYNPDAVQDYPMFSEIYKLYEEKNWKVAPLQIACKATEELLNLLEKNKSNLSVEEFSKLEINLKKYQSELINKEVRFFLINSKEEMGTRVGILLAGDGIAIGNGALAADGANIVTHQNTAVGFNALNLNSSGISNTALGYQALSTNVSGNSNTALGFQALRVNTASSNTAVGTVALAANVGGTNNTAVGASALTSNTSGTNNTALGEEALKTNTTNGNNTAVGNAALFSSNGAGNTAVGQIALFANTTGNTNVAVGSSALQNNSTGSNNTAVGASALQNNTVTGNTAVGFNSLLSNNSGTSNTAVGNQTIQNNSTGSSNTAVGNAALLNNTASSNTAVGASALTTNTSGSSNTAVGNQTLQNNSAGSNNTAVGNNALQNNTTSSNTAVGANVLTANTSGSQNVGIGNNVLTTNISGSSNVGIGLNSLQLATTDGNTAVGASSLGGLTSGDHNTALGETAGITYSTESNNISIVNLGTAGDANTIRIGTQGAGQLQQNKCFIAGIAGVTVANSATVLINTTTGQLGTVASSKRYKNDIKDMGKSSEKIYDIEPVTFKYKPEMDATGQRQYGLIAEQVAEHMPDIVVYNKDGQPETVQYHILNVLLLNELQKLNKKFNEKVTSLEIEINNLKARINS